MKFFRLDLLTLLISLFILGSCKNQDTIGLPVDDRQINGSLLVNDNITVNTVLDDSVATSALLKTPLAAFADPVLGATEANIVTSLNLPSTSYTLPTGTITTDSAVLELRYIDGFYGDSVSSNYKVNVYQLDEPVTGQTYYNNKVWKRKSAVIGSRTFFSRTHTRVRTFNIIAGKPDTLINRLPQLRIPISRDFINTNFFGATAAQLASSAVFQRAVNGLYITLDRGQTTGAGGTFMFNLDSSRVHIYYRAVNGTTIDTNRVDLPLTTHAAEIKHSGYSSAVQAALANQTTSNDVFYLQGLAGLRAKLAFPNLNTLFGTVNPSQVAINRAELVVSPVPGTGVPFVPQPQLTMYRYNIARQRQPIPDANGTNDRPVDPRFFGTGVFGGNYNTNNEYRFVVTGYLQDLLRGQTDYGTFIAPIDTANRTQVIEISPSAQTAGRVIAVGSNKASPYKIRLNIIYTKPE